MKKKKKRINENDTHLTKIKTSSWTRSFNRGADRNGEKQRERVGCPGLVCLENPHMAERADGLVGSMAQKLL